MKKSKRSWFIAASAGVLIASAVGASAARDRAAPAVQVSVVHDLPLPALDRLVTRLAAEARAAHAR